MGLIDDIQIHKEIGAIALSAIELNLNSTIICGQFNFPVKSILLYKTGIIRRNWITKILDPFFALKYILNESPDYMLLYNIENYGNIFLVLALNFLGKIRLSHKQTQRNKSKISRIIWKAKTCVKIWVSLSKIEA